jgi:hypothetical protein
MTTRALVVGAIVCLLGVIAIWFLKNYDYVTDRERTGLRGEARRNAYLAADKMMDRLGMPADEMRSLGELFKLPPSGVLVIGEEREVLTPQLREKILHWVEQGGYLVTEDTYAENSDPLLDTFQVRRIENDEEKLGEDVDLDDWPLVEIQLPGSERAFKVLMHEHQSIERTESLVYARTKYANHVLHFRHGKGYVTVLNSMWFMHNVAIGKHDHAAFVHAMLRLAPDREGIVFFNQPEDLSLSAWLLEHALAVIIATAAAVLLWLWRIIPRFGAILPDPVRKRRSLLEHLRACGRFEWATHCGPQLLEAARELAWRRMARAHPELAAMNEGEADRHVAALSDLQPEEIDRLMRKRATIGEQDFIRSIQVFQRIHAQLRLRNQQSGRNILGSDS